MKLRSKVKSPPSYPPLSPKPMPGGHFNKKGYFYYGVHEFADELETEIQQEPGKYDQRVMDFLRKQVSVLRYVANLMLHIDYLYSGDHGNESFISTMESIMCNADVLPAPTIPTIEMREAAYEVDIAAINPLTGQAFKVALDDEEILCLYLSMIDSYNGITGKCLLNKDIAIESV